MTKRYHWKQRFIISAVSVLTACLAAGGFAFAYHDRIMPRVMVGSVPVGGMMRDQALERLSQRADELKKASLALSADGKTANIPLSIFFNESFPTTALDHAWRVGHEGSFVQRWRDRITVLVIGKRIAAPVRMNDPDLSNVLDEVADTLNEPRRDIRLHIEGGSVKLLQDTKPGQVVRRNEVRTVLLEHAQMLDLASATVALYDDPPQADPALADQALAAAKRMLVAPITLTYEDYVFTISRATIGSWIRSSYEGTRLVPELDKRAMSAYVTTLASRLNIAPIKAIIETQDGHVTRFIPPQPGRALEEEKTKELITETLTKRRNGPTASAVVIPLPVRIARLSLGLTGDLSGISELIGSATTSFAGSPRNRISNIKNGVKFLSGFVVESGQEFSTLGALGTVDNTTGYLPELVIKGDQTIPEFGGGLCQVSTTLFRAVLDAGLPVTVRRNHSYRVSYYEKDGMGAYIGPGLDATIYEPDVDLKFMNDTGSTLMIFGFVQGDKITFELYGTSDGRTSRVIGPKLLSETPPGEPIYTETDTLAKGVTKQIETPHPGGSATATYIVTHADGREAQQKFDSWYRRWPARYLVGTKE